MTLTASVSFEPRRPAWQKGEFEAWRETASRNALADPDISPAAKLVFHFVLWHVNRQSGGWTLKLESIAAGIDMGIRHARRSVAELESHGYARAVARSYRRDFWDQQPHRVQVWSEKGTVRGVLQPVLDEYAIGFLPVHGFSSATAAHDIAEDDDGRNLIVLYVGDYDPSGMFMSEEDLPTRFAKYDGEHIKLRRIALTREQVRGLPSFPATDKKKDTRYKWFRANHGNRCWELDAMDPNDLRNCVERKIKKLIEPEAWKRCEIVNKAEQDSLRHVLDQWKAAKQ